MIVGKVEFVNIALYSSSFCQQCFRKPDNSHDFFKIRTGVWIVLKCTKKFMLCWAL